MRCPTAWDAPARFVPTEGFVRFGMTHVEERLFETTPARRRTSRSPMRR